MFLHNGNAMHSFTYVQKFISYVKENYHTNVYTMLNKEYLNEDDRRTIYMHDFFCMECFLNSIIGLH